MLRLLASPEFFAYILVFKAAFSFVLGHVFSGQMHNVCLKAAGHGNVG